MNKGGQEYSLAIALEYVLLIMIAVSLAAAVYKAPHEERINQLKVLDFSLTLDSVFSVKDDVYLNYDLGQGMNVKFDDQKMKMYQKNENKAKEEYFIKNSNYNFISLQEGEYENLIVTKKEGLVKVEGSSAFEGFGEAELPSGGAGASGGI